MASFDSDRHRLQHVNDNCDGLCAMLYSEHSVRHSRSQSQCIVHNGAAPLRYDLV